ncbi:bzip transcription factor [Pyrrhoderma noxium]|uniref:Bzip transcription factor n=1 Tax=Pyrrhoderma noxium TaxID=2282107 RepID=A0A286UQ54_9AGAM|nr:bzip transcription factor [Pyrrhoderma noxium]
MESAFNSNSLWDLSLPPSLPALADDDFIALLQKQFGGNIPGLEANKQSSQAANINPQNLSRVPIPKPVESPPSDDSPSPPSATDATSSRSRRQSGVNFEVGSSSFSNDLGDEEDSTLKRKASEEDLDDEPNPKSQHTSLNKKGSARRKSTGNASVDETRLLKRKEQNRAAQRAFRERKEKHVKDLEDKVSALEEKNAATQQENDTLREVVSRLQTENTT